MIVGLAHSINSVLRPAKANPRSRGPLTNHSYLLVETTTVVLEPLPAAAEPRRSEGRRPQAGSGRSLLRCLLGTALPRLAP
jgi:hypothetical protein